MSTDAGDTLYRARAILDLLQGAAAHGAIEPPSNGESLAQALGVVIELIDEASNAICPTVEDSDKEVP